MESDKKQSNDDIVNLIGEITEYKSELSDNNYLENLEVENGDFIEKFFNQKLKYLFESDVSSSVTIDLSQILEELIISLNYSILEDPKLDPNIGKEIVAKVDKFLKKETQIQIDSLLPKIDGKKVNKFFYDMEKYSYPYFEKVEENKKYTLVVESTFCLKSQIIKKSEQLRKCFLLFNLIQKLYENYPGYINKYYKYFIRKYLSKEKIEKQKMNSADDDFDFSSYGNYIFIIATNKTFKSFREVEFFTKSFSFQDNDKPDDSFRKCFEIDAGGKGEEYITENKIPKITKIYRDEAKEFENGIQKISSNKKLIHAYKSLNYLFNNINKEKHCRASIIYFDTYLNCITPKCVLLEKLNKISDDLKIQDRKIENQKKMMNNLLQYISEKDPNFDLTKFQFE